MREATLAGLVPATRSCFHRRAALLLHKAGASDEEVAAQLLAAEPGSDPRAARLLLATGRRALAAGDHEVALRHLRARCASRRDARARAAARARPGRGRHGRADRADPRCAGRVAGVAVRAEQALRADAVTPCERRVAERVFGKLGLDRRSQLAPAPA